MTTVKAHCARCRIPKAEKICQNPESGRAPDFCPTIHYRNIIGTVTARYHAPEISEFARLAAVYTAHSYYQKLNKVFP